MEIHSKGLIISDFSLSLFNSIDIEQQFEAFVHSVERLGFDGAAYSYIPKFAIKTQVSVAPVFLISPSYPADFLGHYSTERLDQHDFTILL